MKFFQLKSKLSGGELAPIYLVEGGDAFFRRKAEELLLAPLRESECFDLNYVVFSEDYKLADAVAACRQLPFLAEKRAVVVRECYPKAAELEGNAPVAAYALDPSPDTLLVIVNSSTSEIRKKLKDAVQFVDCSTEEPEVVARWISGMFKQRGISCPHPVAVRLCGYCRADMARIDGEVEKLAAYCEGGEVTVADVDELVTRDTEYQVYELSNALAAKNPARALEILGDLMGKHDLGYVSAVLATLYNFFKRLYVSAGAPESDRTLSEYLGVKEYAVKMSRKTAAAYPPSALKAAAELCRSADVDMKSGKISAAAAVNSVVLGISAVLGGKGGGRV